MLDRFHHREQLLGLLDLFGVDTDHRDHVFAVRVGGGVRDGSDVQEDGDVFDGAARVARALDFRADRRREDRDGRLFAEYRPGLLAARLDVVRLDVGVPAADVLLVDLVEEPLDELRALDPDERVDRLAGDGGVRGTRHEQRRLGRLVGVPGDPRRRRHPRVHARDVELSVDGVRRRILAGVAVGVRALRYLRRRRVELVAPVFAGAPGERDRRRRRECREQSASFHTFR